FGTDNGNNIDLDPLFVGSGADPLDLQATSPCIDAGSNALVPEGILYDILGDARIQTGPAGVVDMGAYEQ
ncbi:MAG TPA: choice-of-anchor Q domain-containing protein, partial [bacterium]|nr:choice-of-anchor Q domain-containing protein [bacterium]